MSCYWVIRCRDCEATSNMELNRGLDELRPVIADLPQILAIYKASEDLELEIKLFLPGPGVLLDRDFLREHQDHTLVVRDEYGRDDR